MTIAGLTKITTGIPALIMLVCFSLPAVSATVTEDLKRAERWNRFVDNLYAFHQKRINERDVYTEEGLGGYGGVTNDLEFYREVKHYDRDTGLLLSSIKWENHNPENLHVIEVYVYDDHNRIKREYIAAYLPVHRKAPFQTLINLHHYDDDLHGYRQFDASDNRLHEFCEGEFFDRRIHISLNDYEIPDSLGQLGGRVKQEAYRACFDAIPRSARRYMNPMSAQ